MAYSLSELNQAGLPPLLEPHATKARWEHKRNTIKQVWLDYIGGLPELAPINMRLLSTSEQTDHIRLHIQYDTVYNDVVSAFLLIPDGKRYPGKRPAMLALHPTHELGKEDIASEKGRANRTYALELVSQGYIVLAPDALTAGERTYPGHPAFHSGPFYEQYPGWSTVAKNITDHRQAINILYNLEDVNTDAIGVLGHSFGGYNAYFLAGMDERIKAVVCSCGVSPFTGDPAPEHWSFRPYPYTHIPKLSADLLADRIPFEFHEIIALAAPVPLFVYAGQSDHIFPHWKEVGESLYELDRLYRWLGREDRFLSVLGSGGHDFPPHIRSLAYQFLHRHLQNSQP